MEVQLLSFIFVFPDLIFLFDSFILIEATKRISALDATKLGGKSCFDLPTCLILGIVSFAALRIQFLISFHMRFRFLILGVGFSTVSNENFLQDWSVDVENFDHDSLSILLY